MSESLRIPLWGQCLALALLVGAVFWPALQFDFLRWDDDIAVTQNELIQADFSAELVGRWFQSDQALRFKPVHWFTGWIWYQCFGLNPVAWHGLNMALHVLVGVGFFLLLRQGLNLGQSGKPSSAVSAVAWVASAVWAVHPLRVEPVAWVTASTYAMATGWLLVSIACYLRTHASGGFKPRTGWLVGAWVFAVLAYGTYPVTVTYALFLVVVDWGVLRCVPRWPEPAFWRWVGKIAAFLVPAVLALSATVWVRFYETGIFTEAPDLARIGISERIVTALAIAAALAGRLVWFADLTPNLPPMVLTVGNYTLLVGLATVTITTTLIAWRLRKSTPALLVGWIAFLAMAIPCLGLTERPTWPVDRYSYLSHLILFSAIAAIAVSVIQRGPRLQWAVAASAFVILGLSVASRQQLGMWRDTDTFFQSLTTQPHFGQNPRQDGHVLLMWSREAGATGDEAALNERREQALQVYLAGIRTALNQADYEEAVSLMTHIHQHFQATAEMYREQGAWLIQLERWSEAEQTLGVALSLKPKDERTRELLAEIPR